MILFIPIRRYTIGGGLPITLEPYRLLIAVVLMAWGLSLLIDPRVRWRKTIVDVPIAALFVSILAGLALNIGWISATGITGEVIKQLSFFVSFLLVMYFVASTMNSRRVDRRHHQAARRRRHASWPIAALVEWKPGYNVFNHLRSSSRRCSWTRARSWARPRVAAGSAPTPPPSTRSRSARCSCCCCRWRSTCSGAPARRTGWAPPAC